MINSDLAAALWPGESAIGRVLLLGNERRPLTVGAVVPNARFSGYDTHERPHFVLVPAQGVSPRGEISFYVRYSGSIDVAAGQIRSALRDVDPRIPVVYMRTLDTELDGATWPVRFIYFLLTLFAAGSLFIAVAGQYALVAFGVRRRTRDFGVRIALGASAHQIIGAVVGDGLRWSAIGLVVGFALSVAVGRLLGNVLVGVTPTDAPTYLAVGTVLFAASLLACYVPARRAAHIDPLQALREE